MICPRCQISMMPMYGSRNGYKCIACGYEIVGDFADSHKKSYTDTTKLDCCEKDVARPSPVSQVDYDDIGMQLLLEAQL